MRQIRIPQKIPKAQTIFSIIIFPPLQNSVAIWDQGWKDLGRARDPTRTHLPPPIAAAAAAASFCSLPRCRTQRQQFPPILPPWKARKIQAAAEDRQSVNHPTVTMIPHVDRDQSHPGSEHLLRLRWEPTTKIRQPRRKKLKKPDGQGEPLHPR